MLNPFTWLKARFNNWLFYREFERAPIKRIGKYINSATYVKEVRGNLYVVDKPLFVPSDMEVIPSK